MYNYKLLYIFEIKTQTITISESALHYNVSYTIINSAIPVMLQSAWETLHFSYAFIVINMFIVSKVYFRFYSVMAELLGLL